jgi:uncharacterized membrane protein YebE (DUF533 family)
MTTELSKTQIEVLKSGAAHDAGHITLASKLRGGARQKVVAGLVGAKLAAYKAGTLVITAAGLAAIGAPERPAASKRAATKASKKAQPVDNDKPAKAPRANTKQARLIEMLKRPDGVTIDEVVKALDWQAHTVRGAISGALKKKLGLTIESEKEGDRRVYRIVD